MKNNTQRYFLLNPDETTQDGDEVFDRSDLDWFSARPNYTTGAQIIRRKQPNPWRRVEGAPPENPRRIFFHPDSPGFYLRCSDLPPIPEEPDPERQRFEKWWGMGQRVENKECAWIAWQAATTES